MEMDIQVVSNRILQFVEVKKETSLDELERFFNIPFNLVFLALDQLVRQNKLVLHKIGHDYRIVFPHDMLCLGEGSRSRHASLRL